MALFAHQRLAAGEVGQFDTLLEAERDFDRDALGERGMSRLRSLDREPSVPVGRLTALRARYHQRRGNDAEALALLTGLLLDPTDAKAWREAVRKDARDVSTPFRLMPDARRWLSTDDRLESAVALADLLADAGQIEAAGLAIATILERASGLELSLALESAASLKSRQQDLDGAIEALQAGLAPFTVRNSD